MEVLQVGMPQGGLCRDAKVWLKYQHLVQKVHSYTRQSCLQRPDRAAGRRRTNLVGERSETLC